MNKTMKRMILALEMCLFTGLGVACNGNDAHEHVYGEWLTITEANCKEGKQIRICETCKVSEEKVIPATGVHNYGEPIIIKEATETEEGSQKIICSICEHEEIQTIAKKEHAHTFVTEIVSPTCGQEGYTKHTCSCGYFYNDEFISPSGEHTFGEPIILVDSTEDSEGVADLVCSICGHKETQIIGKKEHVHVYDTKFVAPTCGDDGYTKHTCKCGDYYIDEIVSPTGEHTFGEPIILVDSTEDSEGVALLVCSICGHKETQIIGKKEHSHTYVTQVIEPTCEKEGYTKHTCKCGYFFNDTYVAPIGHVFTNYQIYEKAKCTTPGKKIATCDREGCDATNIIPYGGSDEHNFVEDTEKQVAVCTKCDDEAELFVYTYDYSGGPFVIGVTDLGKTFTELTIYNLWSSYGLDDCPNLTKLTLTTDGVDNFDHFHYTNVNPYIKEIICDYEVSRITHDCLESCPNIEKLTFNKAIESIENSAFYELEYLKVIEFKGDTQEWKDIPKENMWNDGLPSDCVIKCNNGTLDQYGNIIG